MIALLREWLATLPSWLASTLVAAMLLVLALGSAWLFERFVLAAVRRIARRTRTQLDDVIIKAIHPAVAVLVVIGVIHVGLRAFFDFLPQATMRVWDRLGLALAILAVAIMVARTVGGLLRHWTNQQERYRPIARLGGRIGNVLTYVLAFLVIVDSFGISITPMITSLGIAGLAVALALQDTLSNFFAGVWIQTGRSLQPGHYVRMESEKLEGYIDEVGWRSTKIRQLANNVTVVPNAKFAQAIVTDFHLPQPRMSLLVPISVGYECDPKQVERLLIEEAQAAAKTVEGLLDDPAPFVRFIPGFGDFALQFTLICQVREYVDQYLAQHELRIRILERFRKEGIRIPYPIRETVVVPSTRADVQSTGP